MCHHQMIGLSVCVAAVGLLSFNTLTKLDFIICLRICRLCTHTLLPFTVYQGEAMQCDKTTIAGYLLGLMFAGDTSTSL